jgi:hypothetical protein
VNEISVEFQWTRAEYLRVVRRGVLSRTFRVFALSASSCLIGGALIVYSGHGGPGTFFIVLGIVYLVMAVWFIYSVPQRTWSKGVDIREPMRITVSDEGVATKASTSEARVSWLSYPYSQEWRGYYFLQRTRRAAPKILPKRALKSPGDETELRTILKTHTQAKLLPSVELDGF